MVKKSKTVLTESEDQNWDNRGSNQNRGHRPPNKNCESTGALWECCLFECHTLLLLQSSKYNDVDIYVDSIHYVSEPDTYFFVGMRDGGLYLYDSCK